MKKFVIVVIGVSLCVCSLVCALWLHRGASQIWPDYILWMIGGAMIACVLIPYFIKWIGADEITSFSPPPKPKPRKRKGKEVGS